MGRSFCGVGGCVSLTCVVYAPQELQADYSDEHHQGSPKAGDRDVFPTNGGDSSTASCASNDIEELMHRNRTRARASIKRGVVAARSGVGGDAGGRPIQKQNVNIARQACN